MVQQDAYPHVSDEQIYSELFAAGREDEKLLREVFAPSMLTLAATIGDLVAESANNDILQTATHYHPVNHRIPYTSLPPNVPLPLPNDAETAQTYVRIKLDEHAQATSEDNSLTIPPSIRHEDIAQS